MSTRNGLGAEPCANALESGSSEELAAAISMLFSARRDGHRPIRFSISDMFSLLIRARRPDGDADRPYQKLQCLAEPNYRKSSAHWRGKFQTRPYKVRDEAEEQ